MKRSITKKLILCLLVFCFAAVSVGATKFSKVYDNATQLMVDGDYAGAAELFDSIASYEDSANLSMYCKANLLAEQGKYDEAISAFEFFGDYKDCKYLAVYYSACQIEDEASEDPLTYLNAAEMFRSISLFRDSSARAEGCRQKLYDIACITLFNGDYETSRYYFSALEGFSNSETKLQECWYLQGQDYLKEKQFESAAKAFELAGDYEDSADQMLLAEKLSTLTITSDFLILNNDFDLVHTYGGNYIFLDDKSGEQFFWHVIEIGTDSTKKITIYPKVEIDGVSDEWDARELDSSASTSCAFAGFSNPEVFSEGIHTCVWYIDGIEVLSEEYEVFAGQSEERRAEVETAHSLNVEFFVAQYNENSSPKLSNYTQDEVLDPEVLNPEESFVPVIRVTNPNDKTINVTLSAKIDGEYNSWNPKELEKDDYTNCFSSTPLSTGTHTIQAYIYGVKIGEWSVEVISETIGSSISNGYLTQGEIITFGKYEQDNNISNGPEDIEWLVLDVHEDKALLISKHTLDSKPYNTELTTATWEESSLREWLNNEFLNSAFTGDQKEQIVLTTVNNSVNLDFNNIIYLPDENGNPVESIAIENETEDYVFLLSFMEGHQYLPEKGDRRCQPTLYAIAQGAYEKDGYGRWWYRGTANESGCISCVTAQGSSYKKEITDPHSGVRPAIWISLGTLAAEIPVADQAVENNSGSIRSDTGTGINIHADWSAAQHGQNTLTVSVAVYCDSASLYTTASPDALLIKVADQEAKIATPAIEIPNVPDSVSTLLNSISFDISMDSLEDSSIPIEATWRYMGTYGGKFLETIQCVGAVDITGQKN